MSKCLHPDDGYCENCCGCDDKLQCWEPCGVLGHSEVYVRPSETVDDFFDKAKAVARKMNAGEKVTMPFSGHTPEHLAATLKSINESGLAVEVFDAFLAEYKKTGDLDKARFFALCEWDC